jgi:hypothetical protein
MSMISLTGVLVNVYKAPARNDDEEAKDKIQILGDLLLKNGETKKDLVTVTVPDASEYQGREGEMITLPVGAFAPAKGSVIFYALAR